MLIVFPLGLLGASVVFDIIRIVSGHAAFAMVSYWLIAAGIVGGVLAAIPGLIDWYAIPMATRAKSVGRRHAIVVVIAIAIFFVSWRIRAGAVDFVASPIALALSILAAFLASIGGWLGGELVERLGMSVHDGAHLDAPSSLTRRKVGD